MRHTAAPPVKEPAETSPESNDSAAKTDKEEKNEEPDPFD